MSVSRSNLKINSFLAAGLLLEAIVQVAGNTQQAKAQNENSLSFYLLMAGLTVPAITYAAARLFPKIQKKLILDKRKNKALQSIKKEQSGLSH